MKKFAFLLILFVFAFAMPKADAQTLVNKPYYEYVFTQDTVDNTETLTFTAPVTIVGDYDYAWFVKLTKISGTGTTTGTLKEGAGSVLPTRISFTGLNAGKDSLLIGEVYGTKQALTITGVGTISHKVNVSVVYKRKL